MVADTKVSGLPKRRLRLYCSPKKKKTLPVEVQRAKLPMHRKYFSPNKNNTKVTKLVYALQNSKQSVSNQEFGMNI
jgi:hypothetical protein